MTPIREKLWNAQHASKALNSAYETLKPWLIAGHTFELSIKPSTRSIAANALLHKMLSYIATHQQWAGKSRDVETWKRLLTAAWCRARGEHIEMLPALDGHGVDIVFRKTSTLTGGECAELLEFIFAWGAQNDLEFPADPRQIDSQKRLKHETEPA